ncbi:MAG: hypothetical protein K2M91_00505, partial [Lachnospiraceae bacterium]|nr:hypothetical protein [Lachnospiraceae bacterium]
AQFVYKGTFLVKSSVGGRVATKEEGDKVTFKASASSGYKFDSYNVNGSKYTGTVTAENEITLDRNTYIKEGTSTVVEAVFTKVSAASHKVTVRSGTGGTAYVASGGNTAAAGEEVTIHIVAGSDYVYKEMKITGGITSSASSTNVNERVFTMPDNDVEVEVLFQNKYDKDSRNRIYPESNAGGSITVRKGASGSQYQITIKPDDNYDVDENKALEFTKVTLSGTAGTEIPEAESAEQQEETQIQEQPAAEESSSAQPPSGEEAETSGDEIIPEGAGQDNASNSGNPSDNESSPDNENSSVPENAPSDSESASNELDSSDTNGQNTDNLESIPAEETVPDKENAEDDVQANQISVSVLGKKDLTYDSEAGTYTYIVDLEGDNDGYSAYALFVEKQTDSSDTGTSYNITTASSTGGVVAVDMTSAKEGDKVYVTPTSNDGYVLTSILVNGEKPALESDKKRYSFTMPSRDVEVTAQFEPVDIVLKSNMSGNATYSGNTEGKVTVTVKPSSAYTVESISVTDAGGKKLSVSKKQSGSYVYEFDIAKMSKAPCTVDIKFKKQNKKQAVDTSKTNISDSIDELTKASDKVQKSIQQIRDIVQKSDGAYKSWNELTSSEQDTIVSEVINLVEYLGDMSSAASSILSSFATIYNILTPYVSDAADAAKKDIDKATDHIHSMLDALKAANNGVKGIVNYMNAQPDIHFSKLGDGFDIAKENFHDQLKGLSDSIKALSDNASGYSDIINDDLRAVNDQLNVVFNLLADRMVDIEHLSVEELYEDVDDENIDSITTGRADACNNKGIVKGDINVGGIAGSMSIDDEDPEDSAAGSIEYEIGRRFITKCLVTNSVNEGYITSKKNGAGGICGYMNHGIIVDSESYGSVESTEGDYVGGICGESLTIIKRCYALCSVVGNKNVGGIAGYGETLKNCYSMADVQAENGRAGAIAGQIASYEEMDSDADEGAKVVDNYYVGAETYGIDNISYVGVAEPISYQDLLTVEQLPTQFWHLKVIYKIEDTYLGSEEVKYGETLDKLNFPQIPGKEGFYGVWPDVSDRKMGGTFVVEAEYKDNVTVVQSNGSLDDTEEGTRQKPYALIEDIFTEDTILNAKISDKTPPEAAAGKQNVVYEVTLENAGIKENESFVLRILNPYKDAIVYVYRDGAWTELESKSRGQYLQVSMNGTQEYFCVVEKKSNLIMIIICAAAGTAILIVLIVIIKKRRARRKQKRLKKANEIKK